MINQVAQELAALIRAQFGLHDLLPHLVRLLATAGEPVTVEHAAETGGFTVEQVRAELARHPGVDWDADGRIAGFGATLRPTRTGSPRTTGGRSTASAPATRSPTPASSPAPG